MHVCFITVIHQRSCCELENRVIDPGDMLVDTSDRLSRVPNPLMPNQVSVQERRIQCCSSLIPICYFFPLDLCHEFSVQQSWFSSISMHFPECQERQFLCLVYAVVKIWPAFQSYFVFRAASEAMPELDEDFFCDALVFILLLFSPTPLQILNTIILCLLQARLPLIIPSLNSISQSGNNQSCSVVTPVGLSSIYIKMLFLTPSKTPLTNYVPQGWLFSRCQEG